MIEKSKIIMKRIFTICIVSTLASFPGWPAQQTLTGEISDSMCGASHAGMGDMGKDPKQCTADCVKGGAKYVFVSNGSVYTIQNQGFPLLAANSGSKVQIAGDVEEGKSITVTKISRSGK